MNGFEMEDSLLFRFLTETCSGEDLRKIEEFISADEANAAYLFEMERIWSLKDEMRYATQPELEQAYLSLCNAIVGKKKEAASLSGRKRPFVRWMAYAASVLLVGAISFLFSQYTSEKERIVAENKIEVPVGERVYLTLSDGTKVWLNAQSKISYPSDFSKKDRRVFLEGEGYFEVARDEEKPFIVESASISVKVLGTRFNFRVYDEEPAFVSLLDGKLEVHVDDQHPKLIMLPADELQYSEETGLRIMKRANIDNMSSWITGELYFSEEKLEDIVRVLRRRFSNAIVIKDKSVESQRFSCRIHSESSLSQVLDLLVETRKLSYFIDESNTVYIVTPQ